MKDFFTWLLVLGVLAGSWSRVLAVDPCEGLLQMHAEEHSHHDHDHGQPCDPSHESNCPIDHHNHGSCCHSLPLVAEGLARVTAGGMDFSLSPLSLESWLKPDEPVHDLDKPPLV